MQDELVDTDTLACNQLYESIQELDPQDKIDKKVIARVTKQAQTYVSTLDGRQQAMSA